MPRSTRQAVAVRLYRLLLHLYPRTLRARRRELAELFADQLAAVGARAGVPGQLVYLGRNLIDVVWFGLPARLAEGVRRRRRLRLTPRRRPPGDRGETMTELIRDLGYGYRMARRRPVLSLAIVVSLALGIGATTAIFSVLDALTLRTLPVDDPQQLISLRGRSEHGEVTVLPYLDFVDFEQGTPAFAGLFAYKGLALDLRTAEGSERIWGELVSDGYFSTLGVGAARGRVFEASAGRPAEPVAVLSDRFWRRQLGADPRVLGRTLTINGQPLTVVGVAPAGFNGVYRNLPPDLWLPLGLQPTLGDRSWLTARDLNCLLVMGRLRPEASLANARHQVEAVVARLLDGPSGWSYQQGVELVATPHGFPRALAELTPYAAMTMTAAALVLLVACVNVAGLSLAQGSVRRREIATRLALGAGRGRLVRQLLTESLLLTALGGLAGLAVANLAVRWLEALKPVSDRPTAIAAGLDGRVLAFALAVTAVSGLLCGLVPALRSARGTASPALHGVRAAPGAFGRAGGFRGALVVTQVALSLLLLVAAGLFLATVGALRAVDPGVARQPLLIASVDLGAGGRPAAEVLAAQRRLLERVAALPGVEDVASSSARPVRVGAMAGFRVATAAGVGEPSWVHTAAVSPTYFRTLGIDLVAGQGFSDRAASADAAATAIVNQTFVRRFFAGRPAIGRRIYTGDPAAGDPGMEIVGVVRDGKVASLRETPQPMVFLPMAQMPSWAARVELLVRTAGDPWIALPGLRAAVRALGPEVPLFGVTTLDRLLVSLRATERHAGVLFAAFAGLALALAAVGVFGLLSHQVEGRTREIGIRIALGAGSRRVGRLILGSVALPLALGLALGLALATGATRLLRAQLFGVSPSDPATYAAAAAVLVAVAGFAAWGPLYRALRIQPARALRQD